MATFSSTLDEALVQQLEEAAELTGKALKAKKLKPKEILYPEGTQPALSVFVVSGLPMNLAVRVHEDSDWDETVRGFIPDKDPSYVWDPEFLFALIDAYMNNKPMLVHGPKGSGKTTGFEQFCAHVRMPFFKVNGREDLETGAFFGSMKFVAGEGVVWCDGPTTEACKFGGWFVSDEVSKNPAGINAGLMGIMERGELYLADKAGESSEKFVKPHAWFRLGATDNTELQGDTTGKYVSANVQDEALIDRFKIAFRLGYLSQSHEVSIITKRVKDIDALNAQKMVQLAGMIRESYDSGNIGYTMSPRGLVSWAETAVQYGDLALAFRWTFFNKLTQGDAQVVAEFYHSVFCENLRR